MKKTVITLLAIAITAVWTCSAMSAGTESDWKVSLKFKAEGQTPDGPQVEDLLPVTLGVVDNEQDTDEMLKPPPLPGKLITGNPEDAYVSAYVMTQAARQAAKTIDYEQAAPPAKIWAVDVDVEVPDGETKSVYLDVDFTDSYYDKVTVFLPGETTPVKEFRRTGTTEQELFTSDGTAKTVYVHMGERRSFAVTEPVNNTVEGYIDAGGLSFAEIDDVEVKLYDSSCSLVGTATTTDGYFQFTDVDDGTYSIQASKQYYVGSQIKSLNKTSTGVSIADDHLMYTGDFNDDKKINLFDIAEMKTSVGLTSSDEAWDGKFDTNKDSSINLFDIAELKLGFNSLEEFDCN